ncbi:Secretory lipase [Actinomadura rubteroloni]|uniref:Secretory lipase n=1 Tax=Actinomadura rubteroloni TaxID=1926885 RepID=A0A2P4UL27_9ACTN|nr:lipase family protein [Actinomadura rubteroloni]POM25758.1 Secretory lipase [Actinomadura rubteroloni]
MRSPLAVLAAGTLTALVLSSPSARAALPDPSSTSSSRPSNAVTLGGTALAGARGAVVSVRRVQDLGAGAVRAALREDGLDASRVRHGVTAYRIVYRTIDAARKPTTASGLLVLPRDGRQRLRVVTYAHGTMAAAADAPSVDEGGRSGEGLLFASAGYAAVEPDYLGLGVGPGAHPYLHARSEATATLDLVRASFAFAPRTGRTLDPRLLATGFSQGGQAAMAFGTALRNGADPRFRLAAAAPVSGPYDLRGAEVPAIFDGTLDPKASAYYLAYFLTSWNRLYHLYGSASEVFRAPYDTTVAPLYDGRHGEQEIVPRLPASPQRLLTEKGLAMIQHPTGALAAALDANDRTCRGWGADVPVHVIGARGDEQVAFANARHCVRQVGRAATLTDLGDLGHTDSGRRGVAEALRWFMTVAPPRG